MKDSWYGYDKFIKPEHLDGQGATLKIVGACEVDSAIKKDEKQPALLFATSSQYPLLEGKMLTLNATNRKLLTETFGHTVKACVGKWVHLRAGKAQNGKNTVLLSIASEPARTNAPVPSSSATLAPAPDAAVISDNNRGKSLLSRGNLIKQIVAQIPFYGNSQVVVAMIVQEEKAGNLNPTMSDKDIFDFANTLASWMANAQSEAAQ